MKRLATVFGVFAVATLLTTACNQAEEPREEGALIGEAGSPADAPREAGEMTGVEEQIVSGELKSVDPEGNTLTIQTDDGSEMILSFNEMTDISGGAGPQGLTGREGARVTVHYRERPGAVPAASTREAVRIIMAE